MEFLRPTTLAEALAAAAEYPDAVPIAGGTDVMVELNFDRHRPERLLDLNQVAELYERGTENGRTRIGAAVSYSTIIAEYGKTLPGLAMAARTVGSPQIRNRGSVGGNLGAASPAGDSHPPLLAADAEIEIASAHGARMVPAERFYLGVKRNALEPGELVTAVHLSPADGPQQFSKIGTRNAMVIAVCALGLALHPSRGGVGVGLGSAAPVPKRAADAEQFLAGELDWEHPKPLSEAVRARFGELVSAAADPIDDTRGSAAYRKHAISVLASRTLDWAWSEYSQGGRRACA